jgi:Na+/melibiose symporter-like transporter
MAIMGFGGGALIGAPLGVKLMAYFKTADSSGVAEAFMVMALLYAISMLFGALIVRVPPEGWKPEGWEPTKHAGPMMTSANVGVDEAWKTPQFWCLWVVLCMNVSAGIGILGQASKMCSDMFGVSAAVGGGFAGLLSIFNMGGRFVWSSVSDYIGRKAVYCIYFVLGAVLYCAIPWTQAIQNTAWSVAALVGPSLVNYISTAKIEAGVPKAEAYSSTMYLMAGLLMIGLVANLLVRPVDSRYHIAQPK